MRITKHIPNTITCLNALSGCAAVLCALRGLLLFSAGFMALSVLFDFLDGMSARLLKAYSDTGKELDSLADVISFGVAPASLLYVFYRDALSVHLTQSMDSIIWEVVCFIPYLFVACAALRLAKFNIDTRQSENFLGLATPAAAILIASLLLFASANAPLYDFLQHVWVVPAITLILCFLMLCELPMFSLKIKHLTFKDNKGRVIFISLGLCIVLLGLILGWHWSLLILLIVLLYIILSLVFYFLRIC